MDLILRITGLIVFLLSLEIATVNLSELIRCYYGIITIILGILLVLSISKSEKYFHKVVSVDMHASTR